MNRLIIAFGLVLALPLALSAQQGQERMRMHQPQGAHPGMGVQQGMMGMGLMSGMHGMMMSRPGPGMMLRLQETLELTDEQVSELEAMHAEAHESMQQHQQAAAEARTRARDAMMADADLDAFEGALAEAADHQVQAAMAMVRVHMQAGQALTDAQSMKLQTLMEAMKEMHHEGMMGEGMQQRMQRMHQGMRSGG